MEDRSNLPSGGGYLHGIFDDVIIRLLGSSRTSRGCSFKRLCCLICCWLCKIRQSIVTRVTVPSRPISLVHQAPLPLSWTVVQQLVDLEQFWGHLGEQLGY